VEKGHHVTDPGWHARGDWLLSCNCDVFCPCVISLGRSRPTQGHCVTWYAFHLEEGRYGETDLAGRTVVAPAYSPGPLLEGGWTIGLYLDEGTTDDQERALARIFTGAAGGPIRLWSFLVARHLGVQKASILFEKGDRHRAITIPKTLECSVVALRGGEPAEEIRLTNLPYWIGREVVVCRTEKGRFRGFGFNWETGGKSAEYGVFNWTGS